MNITEELKELYKKHNLDSNIRVTEDNKSIIIFIDYYTPFDDFNNIILDYQQDKKLDIVYNNLKLIKGLRYGDFYDFMDSVGIYENKNKNNEWFVKNGMLGVPRGTFIIKELLNLTAKK